MNEKEQMLNASAPEWKKLGKYMVQERSSMLNTKYTHREIDTYYILC